MNPIVNRAGKAFRSIRPGAAIFFLSIVACLLLFTLSTTSASSVDQPLPTPSSLEMIKEDFGAVPCKDDDRRDAVKSLFVKMGASSEEIETDKYKDVENLILRKKGTSGETIVLGAHYDKVREGCGAVDNWTGIVTIAHLFKSYKDVTPNKTLVFVAFGKEERGLVGSRAMVEGIQKDQVSRYCGMINIDSLGLSSPQVADNMSTRKLEEAAAGLAKEMKIPFAHASIPGADADSTSFIRGKIPAITIHGLSTDWRSILHSRYDQPAKVKPESVYLGYRLALALLYRVDQGSCDAYR
jgi:Zn-dependent M28 family amino/carboxypeptidase